MKIIKSLLVVAALFAVVLTASAQTNAAPSTSLTPDQLAKVNAFVDNVLPLVPASQVPLAAKIIGWLATLGVIIRAIVGFKNNGVVGIFTGLLAGTNAPRNPAANPPAQNGARGGDAGLRLLLCLALPAALFLTGCGSIPHQLVDNESGTGLKAKIPVGYNGNNIFELDLTVGTFKHTSMIQPVETNRVFTPDLVVAAATRGKFVANAMNTSTNATVSTTGGDAYTVATGHTQIGITNNTDIGGQTWQDAPPSAAKLAP
jgi:hypothetical protein